MIAVQCTIALSPCARHARTQHNCFVRLAGRPLTPAEGRTEPQEQPETVERDKSHAPSSPPPISAERADNQGMSVDRAALQLKNLLEYCMDKAESFDRSRNWTADVQALYIAIDKLEE